MIRKRVSWILIASLLIAISYFAMLSDPMIDESISLVNIDSYISKIEMSNDIDSLTFTFEKVHPNPYRFFERMHFLSRRDAIKKELPDSLSIINFWRIIDQLIIEYNDAHSNTHDSYILTDYVKKGGKFFPFPAKISNKQITITGGHSMSSTLPPGTEIIKINGRTSEELISDLLKHASKETQPLKVLEISDDFGFYLWKSYEWEADYQVQFKKNEDSSIDSIEVEGILWKDRINYKITNTESYSFKVLEDNVGYMKISDFNGHEKDYQAFYKHSFQTLKDLKARELILDFRGHDGGADSYGEHLAKYIAHRPFRKLSKALWKITPEFKDAFDKKFIPKSIRWFKPIYLINEYSRNFYGAKPYELKKITYDLKNPLPINERFEGNVYLIIDHNTFSAGSIFAEMFKHYNMGKIIGQPTGNLYSFNGFAIANFTLPNSKLTYQVSSVYNIANNGEEGLKSVEPDDLINQGVDPIAYIFREYILK